MDVTGAKYQLPIPINDAYLRIRNTDGAKISALLHGLKAMFRSSSSEKAIGKWDLVSYDVI